MPKIVFGPQLPTAGRFASMEAIGRVAQDAEALGYRAVFMRDHIERDLQQHLMHTSTGFCEEGLDPGDPNMFECMTTMGYLAHATSSVEIGVMVLLLAGHRACDPCRRAAHPRCASLIACYRSSVLKR